MAQIDTNRKILVVEDAPDNLALVGHILRAAGYTVQLQDSGVRALEEIHSNPPELILLDINMPGIDGYEICARLKADPLTASIPVLFLSALADAGDIVKAFEAGGQDFISKPFRPEEMLARVKTHLALRGLQEEAVRRASQLELLNRIGVAITSGLELDTVLRNLFEQCRELMPIDSFYVALLEPDSGKINFPLYFHESRYINRKQQHLTQRPGLTGHVIHTRQTLYLSDMNDARLVSGLSIIQADGRPARSYLGVPLIVQDNVIGVISVQSFLVDAYTSEQIHILEMVAIQAAIALENARLFSEVQRLAITDSMTGLYNRRHFLELAEREFERIQRYPGPLSIILFDIDYFKRVNDTLGHLAGDQALRMLAETCRKTIRQADTLGRYGGEEFLVLLPNTDLENAVAQAERLRCQVESLPIPTERGTIKITISLGVAGYRPGDTLDSLIRRADDAMYHAKNNGRNRVDCS